MSGQSHLMSTEHRPCWFCRSFERMVYGGTAARCTIDGRVRIEAAPARGCAFWQREPGSDDEPGPPTIELHRDPTPQRRTAAG